MAAVCPKDPISSFAETRRHFLARCPIGLGAMAMAALADRGRASAAGASESPARDAVAHPPRAKSVIYLHMAGSPPQHDLFDYKPLLNELDGKLCPTSFIENRRLPFIKGHPKLLGTPHRFSRHPATGQWISSLLPRFAGTIDRTALVTSMRTDQFNHAPAELLLFTGSPQNGRPSMGSWITYGLGSMNSNLPAFVVLVSGGSDPTGGKSLWSSGFLPSVHQGVQCRSVGDPILYVSDPKGMARSTRRRTLDALRDLNRLELERVGDPEILTRIEQYELAFRMQTTVPDVMDIEREPEATRELYGAEAGKASFANNCLLARRLVERGVRFVQLFHWGWDSHGASANEALNVGFVDRCNETDRATAALLKDLDQRGLLEDTLVVWGGEFGRTPMSESGDGRDHNPYGFTVWMAGGGVKGGTVYGATDEFGFQAVENRMHVHDLHATMLHLLGFDHEKLTFHYAGRDFRLTDVEGRVVHELIA
jgi:hypothetical protein